MQTSKLKISVCTFLGVVALVVLFGNMRSVNAVVKTVPINDVTAPSVVAVAQGRPVTIDQLPDATVYGDFVVGPGKVEVELAPGESKTFELSVSNRIGKTRSFAITEEDFKGSNDPDQTVVLLGDDRGPYSLRDYIHAASSTVTLSNGYRAHIPVTISIPANAEPGGLYGSIIVGTVSDPVAVDASAGAVPSSPVITRIGTLFFVRVSGPVYTAGKLTDFSLSNGHSIVWDSSSIKFNILYQNTGNISVNPYGTIVVNNLTGSPVSTIQVEPWFAMPQSTRFRQLEWKPGFLFGRYVAHASINRGYGSTTDEMELVFWVIQWKIIVTVLLFLIIVISLIRWIFSKFTIVSKKKK
jgi:hypothetical protein